MSTIQQMSDPEYFSLKSLNLFRRKEIVSIEIELLDNDKRNHLLHLKITKLI